MLLAIVHTTTVNYEAVYIVTPVSCSPVATSICAVQHAVWIVQVCMLIYFRIYRSEIVIACAETVWQCQISTTGVVVLVAMVHC